MLKVNILFFARARELVGTNDAQVEVPEGATVTTVVETIEHQFPEIKKLQGAYTLAINQEYIFDSESKKIVVEGDEIAIITPISGG